jgi:isoleucyl-tRNA synthetase
MFQAVSAQADLPRLEEEVLRYWNERGIYEKSLQRRQGAPRFVFYEGPPTANGMPHPGHCLTRAIKDLFPRYKTMRGYYCERKAGWDTHGLPVEVEVCKELGIHSKDEIEAFGVEAFIHRCQASVWRYMKEWERLTQRLGFWIHLEEAYVTYHQSYVESVWWSLKQLFDRGLLYRGHKIVWWWAQGGTALSSGEVGQGYRQVADPSAFVRFPLLDAAGQPTDTALVVWTTTPWTLPSNEFVAVHPDVEYAVVVDEEAHGRLIVARALVEPLAEKVHRPLRIETTCLGRELVGRRYLPPFDGYYRRYGDAVGRLRDGGSAPLGWRVVAADFVTLDSGTGLVHLAPAYGEVDYDMLLAEQARFEAGQGPPLLNAVAPDGTFTDQGPEYCRGRWVKDCDKEILRDLKARGLLWHQEQYLHDYPFCWRAEEDPLIQYPRQSWFIRTTQLKHELLANNEQIHWLPEHIQHGRFGNFLETNVDWALSRERYWGTPLPIWVCEQTGQMEAIGSYAELLAKPGVRGQEVWQAAKRANPDLPDDLRVHKPYIDAVTYDSPFAPGARMRRVSEVIDCWYDSGAMPFAQWGYRGEDGPAEARQRFHDQFPADFISEALDQTRGWFYSLLAISTLLFGRQGATVAGEAPANRAISHAEAAPPASSASAERDAAEASREAAIALARRQPVPYPHPFRNCVVLGLMLGEDGQKMSKSKRNYREPFEIFDRYGADALRWFFFANQPPWTTIRYAERAIKDCIPEFLLRLWNCYSFFVIYANIDGFDPVARMPAPAASGRAGPAGGGGGRGGGCELTHADLALARGFRPVAQRSELDRWVLSELYRTAAAVVEHMDRYESYEACRRLHAFVEGLSNWYVRRSRDRFWARMDAAHEQDKLDAYWTLYECLLTTCKLIAPFTPFLAETIWQNLAGVFFRNPAAAWQVPESVHLCDYPTGHAEAIDPLLSERMALLRQIASLGLSARMAHKLKVRQPLGRVEVILSDDRHQSWLEAHDALLRDELNVKQIAYTRSADYITYQVLPNFKRLGPRLGKLLPAVQKALAGAEAGRLLAELQSAGQVVLAVEGTQVVLDREDLEVRLKAKPGWAAAQGAGVVVVLSTELTPELIAEGLARDFIRLVQERRKELGLQFTERIRIAVGGAAPEVQAALEAFRPQILEETLGLELRFQPLQTAQAVPVELNDQPLLLAVEPVPSAT